MHKRAMYDLVIIGAGSGGLMAAEFAAKLGAKTALVEKERIGGDCTWSGCVPSKALLKVAKVAHELRTSAQYGVTSFPPEIDMAKVRAYIRRAIEQIYQFETPERLQEKGIDVFLGGGRFVDAGTIQVQNHLLTAKRFLICTGAHPFIPPVAGLQTIPFLTYAQIFDHEQLPNRMIVIGAGPVGVEIAQAYQRLGCHVTLVGERLLPKEEPEVQTVLAKVFRQEGMNLLLAKATTIRRKENEIVVIAGGEEVQGDTLFVATGRRATVQGLDLEKAGVHFKEQGIPVDSQLRTNVKHIYAAGDVLGGYQFTHFAAWQAFQAARNALLPGNNKGFTQIVPWVTFTQPEVAHAGTTEAQARQQFRNNINVHYWEMSQTDRAICENAPDGFLKLITQKDGTLVGATLVSERAGEAISELVLALNQQLKLTNLANNIHPYPTYSIATQQLAAQAATHQFLTSPIGKILQHWTKRNPS